MRNPPRSCDLHGGFFAPSGLPKPLPLGEVSPKVTERASPAGKNRCAAMGRLFVRAILSQRLGFAVSILALSVGLTPASSPRGGAIGMSVRLSFVQPLSLASLAKAGLRLPASAALRLRLAGRCPNSSSLFPPLAAVVAVAPSRGASGETVHFAGTAKASPFGRGGIAKQ